MTSLIIGPIYLTYEKVKEHREGKKKIRNAARYEALRREHEGTLDERESEEARLDQQRMKTGFALPQPTDDGQVRLSRDWEENRYRQWEARERQLEYERFRAAALRPTQTGSRANSAAHQRDSWHGDYRTKMGSSDVDEGRESPLPRRSLQVGRRHAGFESNDNLSAHSSQYEKPRSDLNRPHDFLEPQTLEIPKPREEEPKDMSSLFVDDLLRERGLAR